MNTRLENGLDGSARRSELLRLREIAGFDLGTQRADVRGWQVYTHDAQLVGFVDAMFVDMRAKAIRYLGIALRDPVKSVSLGTVLVPVGVAARLHEQRALVLGGLSAAQLARAPRVARRAVTRADEDAALATYGMATSRDVGHAALYAGANFAEQTLFG